jgi:hypothetical protein
MPRTKEPSAREVVTHIMTILKVYEASCDKVGRIEVYCNGILRDIKELANERNTKRIQDNSSKTAKSRQVKRKTNKV